MRGSPFFDAVEQTTMEIEAGSFRTPCCYYDSSELVASFPARLRELRRLVSDGFEPARLAPGVGIVQVGVLDHRDSDAGSYGEAIVAALLNHPPTQANVPGRILWSALGRRRLHLFVLHLPVTTELARAAGVAFYGYPKFLADVELGDDGRRVVGRLAEGAAEIFRLSAERPPTAPGGTRRVHLHAWMNGQPQAGEFASRLVETGGGGRRGVGATLTLGTEHPIALELERLLLSRRALSYAFTPKLEAILFGPERLTIPLLRRGLEAIATAERERVAV